MSFSSKRRSVLLLNVCLSLGLAQNLSAQVTSASPQNPVPQITAALKLQNFDEALRICATALKNSPDNPTLWTLQGFAFAHAQHPAEALESYNHALKLAPGYLPALEGAAELRYLRADPRAIPLLRQILVSGGEPTTAHAMLAVLEYKQKQCAPAVADFKLASASINTNPAALDEYGFCLVEEKQISDAIPILQQALDLQPGSSTARFNVALAQFLDQQNKPALETLQPLLASTSPSNKVLNLAADISQALEDIPGTVALLRRAIVLQPTNVDNYLKFATLSSRYGSYRAGIAMLDTGITRLPASAPLHVARGILYSQLYMYDKALDDFEQANRLDPNLSIAASAEGIMESQQQNSDAAIQTFRNTLKRRPGDAFTQYLLAEALSQKGYPAGSPGYSEEVAAATRSIHLQPGLAAPRDLLAALYLQSNRFDLAIQMSQAALKADPTDQQALYHLILALRRSGRNADVPPLVQRLADLRKSSASQPHERYQITVGSPDTPQSPSAPAP